LITVQIIDDVEDARRRDLCHSVREDQTQTKPYHTKMSGMKRGPLRKYVLQLLA